MLFSVFRLLNIVSPESDLDASVQNVSISDNGDLVYEEEEIEWCSGEMVRLSPVGKRMAREQRARGQSPEDFQGYGGPKAKTFLKEGVPTAPASQEAPLV